MHKTGAQEILGDATFELHKWNSNIPQLEAEESLEDQGHQSYAKQQLMVKQSESKFLGLKWNKHRDILAVTFPDDDTHIELIVENLRSSWARVAFDPRR